MHESYHWWVFAKLCTMKMSPDGIPSPMQLPRNVQPQHGGNTA